jgi:hypothetical protein
MRHMPAEPCEISITTSRPLLRLQSFMDTIEAEIERSSIVLPISNYPDVSN